jgi:hypothetical protein
MFKTQSYKVYPAKKKRNKTKNEIHFKIVFLPLEVGYFE